jgi:hypothetical protein
VELLSYSCCKLDRIPIGLLGYKTGVPEMPLLPFIVNLVSDADGEQIEFEVMIGFGTGLLHM